MAKKRAQRKQKPKKSAARKSSSVPSRKAPPRHVPTRGLSGWITHTELASSDPAATKAIVRAPGGVAIGFSGP